MNRRLAPIAALAACASVAASAPALYPVVKPGITLAFPRDHGAHPAFRTEWWYVTGWLRTAEGADLGFQVTFFRTRPQVDPNNRSRFAPGQVVFVHAALSDPKLGRLLHGERAARAGFSLAGAATGETNVAIRDWHLRGASGGGWVTQVAARDFNLALTFAPTQPPLLQGESGYSRKGPHADAASYYYSVPHLKVSGQVRRGTASVTVTGEAWLDREWSSNYLQTDAQGWDWTGLNFDDGSALMAFRIRRKTGGTLWAGGTLRRANGTTVVLAPGDVAFRPLKQWRSPATGALYPVAQELVVRLPEGIRRWPLEPLFAAQELDARRSGLPVYWEGAVRTRGGRGYLELTGYDRALTM